MEQLGTAMQTVVYNLPEESGANLGILMSGTKEGALRGGERAAGDV
jgi:hypothetical protein